jgi:hypothetical protein
MAYAIVGLITALMLLLSFGLKNHAQEQRSITPDMNQAEIGAV